MFYKVLKEGKVIDVLDKLTFVKYDDNRNRIVLCGNKTAQGIVSSNGNTVWHVRGYHSLSCPNHETVDLYEINEAEYHKLKALNGKTPEEIIDEYTLYLIEGGII